MSTRNAASLLTAVAIFTCPALAQTADEHVEHHPGDLQQIEERFEQMDEAVNAAQQAQGEQRRAYMHEHMQLMHTQMQAMRGMMGQESPAEAGEAMPMMGIGNMDRMHQHMESMHRMMEQMISQQEMIIENMEN